MLPPYSWMAVAVIATAMVAPLGADTSGQYLAKSNILERPLSIEVSTRVRRETQKRQGIFSLLGQLVRQTKNDTESAYQQISKLISESIASDNETMPAQGGREGGNDTDTSTPMTPYRATAGVLRTILRRNFLGLRNLFQKEWRTALIDSNKNVVAAGKEFRAAIRPIIANNSTSKTER